MSSWGNLDNVTIAGTVVVATANANAVLGVSTYFTSNIKDGDYITIASNKYQVEKVLSDTSLYLTSDSATTSSGVKAFVQQGPKFIANVASGNLNDPTIQNVYGIDKVEIGVPENKARGVAHTGWVTYKTYSDAHSQTRHKSEVLVAMSKNFSANATNELFGTGAGQDANDDTVAADYLLYFTLQPVAASNTAGGTASLVAAAASDPAGDTISYQWSKKDNTTATVFTDLANGGNISGATSNTLVVSNVSNVNGNVFKLTISGTSGADSNTSDAVAITVA